MRIASIVDAPSPNTHASLSTPVQVQWIHATRIPTIRSAFICPVPDFLPGFCAPRAVTRAPAEGSPGALRAAGVRSGCSLTPSRLSLSPPDRSPAPAPSDTRRRRRAGLNRRPWLNEEDRQPHPRRRSRRHPAVARATGPRRRRGGGAAAAAASASAQEGPAARRHRRAHAAGQPRRNPAARDSRAPSASSPPGGTTPWRRGRASWRPGATPPTPAWRRCSPPR